LRRGGLAAERAIVTNNVEGVFMIPADIRDLLRDRGYMPREGDTTAVRRTLVGLGIDPSSELGAFYMEYDPSVLLSAASYEQLEDVVVPVVEGQTPVDADPYETPVGMATAFVRNVWELPARFICLTTTEGEGAYLYDLTSGAIYDFALHQQNQLADGMLSPRWTSFFQFIRWYLSPAAQ
jgi:hypothetical protein